MTENQEKIEKTCIVCNRTLPLDYFNYEAARRKKLFTSVYCKGCHRLAAQKSYLQNRDEKIQYVYNRRARLRYMRNKNQPLKTEVKNGALIISIGIETLADAAKQVSISDNWRIKKMDQESFAQDVCNALLKENEVGASALSDLFDKVTQEVIDSGVDSVTYKDSV